MESYEGRPLYDPRVFDILFDTDRFPGGAIRDDDTLADIGTGQGRLLTSLFNADAFKQSNVSFPKIYAVDPSVIMLTALEAKFRARNIDILEGRFQSLPLPDNSVDVVTCGASIRWGCLTAEDTKHTKNELHRVLKPEGRLIILSDVFSQEVGATRRIHDLQTIYNDRFMEKIGMGDALERIYPQEDFGAPVYYSYSPTPDQVRDEFKSHVYIDTLSDDEKAQVFDDLDAIMAEHVDAQGKLHLQRACMVIGGYF